MGKSIYDLMETKIYYGSIYIKTAISQQPLLQVRDVEYQQNMWKSVGYMDSFVYGFW